MLEVDVIIQSGAPAILGAATDRFLMRAVGNGRRAVLRISELDDRILSLGRYHLAPKPVRHSAVPVARRVCGGRALPAGEGYRTVSLVLPHRSALVSDDPYALAPFQVLNRFARGLLQGYKGMGVPAYYPGRDLVTVNGSILATLSFECDPGGSTLLEAHLATGADFTAVAALLEAVDTAGMVTAELWTPEAATSLGSYLGRAVDIEEMAAAICRGYESQFPITFRTASLSNTEVEEIEADVERAGGEWLEGRGCRPGMDRHAVCPVQVGVLEARFSIDQRNRIDSIVFAGDFIANSAAVEMLERRLHGCPLQADAVDRIVFDIFDGRQNFILGLGKLHVISRLLAGEGAA